MRIWFISDTHCAHQELTIPEDIDLVIHCGDEANDRNPVINTVQSYSFFQWFKDLPIPHKIFVPGNHSTGFEQGMVYVPDGITVLADSPIEIEGIKLYGSPWTPTFGDGWAYMKNRSHMSQIWHCIPPDTNVLITHGPPKSILDVTHDWNTNKNLVQVGCKALLNRVAEIKPTIHAFGHIHDETGIHNYGTYRRKHTTFINASICDLRGNFKNDGITGDLAFNPAGELTWHRIS